MIRYARPARPPGWPPAKITKAITKVSDDLAAGQKPTFPEHWGEFKHHFEAAQFSKCGFCESNVTAVHTGAVEHHAPKSEVQRLGRPGKEGPNSSNLADKRETPTEHHHGYSWLAYEWDNWLYACDRCNSAWKRCLYPVQEDPHPPPAAGTGFTRLLLHPFDDDPLDHLDFDDLGFILTWQGSRKGGETIATCGLDRESLRKAREDVADWAVRMAGRWLRYSGQGHPDERESLDDLLRFGADRRPYAAVVRAVARRVTGLAWSDIVDLAA